VSSSCLSEDVLSNSVTVASYAKARISYRWTNRTLLQLVISSAEEQDSGTYLCFLNEHTYLVTKSLLLAQRMSG